MHEVQRSKEHEVFKKEVVDKANLMDLCGLSLIEKGVGFDVHIHLLIGEDGDEGALLDSFNENRVKMTIIKYLNWSIPMGLKIVDT